MIFRNFGWHCPSFKAFLPPSSKVCHSGCDSLMMSSYDLAEESWYNSLWYFCWYLFALFEALFLVALLIISVSELRWCGHPTRSFEFFLMSFFTFFLFLFQTIKPSPAFLLCGVNLTDCSLVIFFVFMIWHTLVDVNYWITLTFQVASKRHGLKALKPPAKFRSEH